MALSAEDRPRRPLRHGVLLGAILLITLALRLSVFFSVYETDPSRIMQPDSPTYENPARALIRTGQYAAYPDRPDWPEVSRTPGFPLFIAAVYRVFGERRAALMVAQILISVGTIALAYVLGRWLAGPGVGLAAALLLALDPVSFAYSQLMLSETLFTFVLAGGLITGVALSLKEKGGLGLALVLGLLLAAATLVRPLTQFLIYPVLLLFLLVKRRRGFSWRRAVALIGLILLPWTVLVFGWQARNVRVAGLRDLSTIESYNMLYYRGAGIIALRDGITLEAAREKIERTLPATRTMPAGEQAQLYKREAVRIALGHPLLALRVQVAGMARLLLGPEGSSLRRYLGLSIDTGPAGDLLRLRLGEYVRKWPMGRPGQFLLFVFEAGFLVAIYGGVFWALVCVAKTRDKNHLPAHVFLWGVLLYLVGISGGPEAYSRFRTPLMPILAVYAALGFGCLRVWLGRRRRAAAPERT